MTNEFLNQTGTTAAATTTSKSPSWLTTTLDTLKFGVSTWSDAQRRQAEADTAAAALKLENLKLAALKQEAINATATGTSLATKVKSYGTPIAIAGVVVALGIATYFYFKKKKA
jgi:hypothetical protein